MTLFIPSRITSRKRLFILLFVALGFPICKACAQSRKPHILMSAIMEKTILEKQAGGSLCLQLPSLWRVGGFYQSTIDNRTEGTENATFWGGIIAAPVV